MTDYTNILVGVDGSKESEQAFDRALTIAKKNGAKLTVAHIIDDRAFKNQGIVIEQAEGVAKDLLASLENKAKEASYTNIEYVIQYGSPKDKIVNEMIPQQGIDLVICGATGINAFERIFIGSVSDYIVRNAKCDVLISRNDN